MESVEYCKLKVDRRFGVEFEVSSFFSKQDLASFIEKKEKQVSNPKKVLVEGGTKGWAESHENNYWHVKYDSSCGPTGNKSKDHGWEIASYIGSSVEDIDWIAGMAANLSESKVETNTHCGLHIHAETSDFSPEQMGVLHSHWLRIEPWIIHSLPKHRKNNKHCKPLSKAFKYDKVDNPAELWMIFKPSNFGPHENKQKKVAINSVGYAQGLYHTHYKRKTLELRMPECILDESYVSNWIVLYLHFIHNVKNRSFIPKTDKDLSLDEVFWILGLGDKNPNTLVVLDKKLTMLKIWFLERLVANSHSLKVAKTALEKLRFITQLS